MLFQKDFLVSDCVGKVCTAQDSIQHYFYILILRFHIDKPIYVYALFFEEEFVVCLLFYLFDKGRERLIR